jgi:hypothetical protein
MCELFVFQTLVDREAPNVEQEPVTMIRYDHQSRWKAWMRMLAVDIRPITLGAWLGPGLLRDSPITGKQSHCNFLLRANELTDGRRKSAVQGASPATRASGRTLIYINSF